jgi:hypothetical protein
MHKCIFFVLSQAHTDLRETDICRSSIALFFLGTDLDGSLQGYAIEVAVYVVSRIGVQGRAERRVHDMRNDYS